MREDERRLDDQAQTPDELDRGPGAEEFGPLGPSVPPEPGDAEIEDWDEELPPPPWSDAARAAALEAEGRRQPPRAATIVAFGVVVLALLSVVMIPFTVRLYLRHQQALATLDASVERVAQVYAGPGADDATRRRVAWLQRTLREGDFVQARTALEGLSRPAPAGDGREPLKGDGSAPRAEGEPPDPMEARDLPESARSFFADNAELWKGFFGFSVAIVRLERRGAPVDDLEALRASMVEAARLGNVERVEELLGNARAHMQRLSGEALPDSLQQKLQGFARAFARAREQDRDVRRAADLAQRSEAAAKAGKFERAEALLDDAIAALRSAPRGRLRPPQMAHQGRGAPPMGPELGFLRFAAQLFSQVMKSEERDLTVVWESINNAALAIREHNAEQIREILDEAVEAMHTIGNRRREMSRALEQAQQQARATGEGRPRPPAERQQRTEVIMERIGAILARVRELPAEQYEAAKPQIARDLIAAVTAPVEQAPAQQDQAPTAEARVRAKMRIAGQLYAEARARGLATEEPDEAFAAARELITEHEYEQAEKLVDEAVVTLRALMEGTTLPTAQHNPDVIELEDGTSIDLRGIVGPEPLVAPPSPAGTTAPIVP